MLYYLPAYVRTDLLTCWIADLRTCSLQADAYYDGGWHRGEMAGSGTRRYESGDVYAGDFSRGLRHGEGALRCVGGESYAGEWADDLKHGGGMHPALQPRAVGAATPCSRGGNPVQQGPRPHV